MPEMVTAWGSTFGEAKEVRAGVVVEKEVDIGGPFAPRGGDGVDGFGVIPG
jgi:hypothetical protein